MVIYFCDGTYAKCRKLEVFGNQIYWDGYENAPMAEVESIEDDDNDIDACSEINCSTRPRYFANMVSASSYDSAYDENDELYKYYVAGYFSADHNNHPFGLAESLYTNDLDEVIETAWDYINNGDYIEITNQITGKSLTWDPEEWEEETYMDDINAYLA